MILINCLLLMRYQIDKEAL